MAQVTPPFLHALHTQSFFSKMMQKDRGDARVSSQLSLMGAYPIKCSIFRLKSVFFRMSMWYEGFRRLFRSYFKRVMQKDKALEVMRV